MTSTGDTEEHKTPTKSKETSTGNYFVIKTPKRDNNGKVIGYEGKLGQCKDVTPTK